MNRWRRSNPFGTDRGNDEIADLKSPIPFGGIHQLTIVPYRRVRRINLKRTL
jgi:hypothetical protein